MRARARARWLWIAGMSMLGALSAGCGQAADSAGQAPGGWDVFADGLPRVDLAALERIVAQTAAEDRVLVVDFWATWCGPCVTIFGPVHEAIGALGKEVRLVSVTLDASRDEAQAIHFLADHHALQDAYMLMPDRGAQAAVGERFGERWRDLMLPAILVFDRHGALAQEFIGPEAEPEAIAEAVRRLLAQS